MIQYNVATFGLWELLLVFAIVVLIFGAGKLPQLGEALGKSIRNFKKGFQDEAQEIPGQLRQIETETDRVKIERI